MTFVVGNTFWEYRKKHGKEKKYTPSELWEGFLAYMEWAKANPWKQKQLLQKVGQIIDVPTERPMTVMGFCLHIDIVKNTFDNYEKDGGDYLTVTTRIREIIHTQKFEGAAVGAFNANIIARELGLADKQEHTGKDGADLLTNINITVVDSKTPVAQAEKDVNLEGDV